MSLVAVERDQLAKQLDRLINSQVLHSSESLCRLLQYLAKHAIEHPGAPLKEYQIATEVLGKRADFDPQVDSAIRVQAGRLRTKLAEYYSSEGAHDQIIVELPKGSYLLTHHARHVGNGHSVSAIGSEPEPAPGKPNSDHRRWLLGAALACLVAVALVTGTWQLANGRTMQPLVVNAQADAVPQVFQQFWGSFVSQPEDPWVVFSNAAFVGRPETGMRYFNASSDSRKLIWDHYTGVGEVLAVHSLDQVFGEFRRNLKVKRGSLFSLDDAQNNSLIFLGSPSENLSLGEIPSTKEFVFQRLTLGPRTGDLAIVNRHPQGTEAKEFVASPSNSPLTDDYAVVALITGLNSSRSVVILAGTTTFGTEGAAEYVSRQNTLQNLVSRLNLSSNGEVKPFEALLHVRVARGVPMETELVAVRSR
jgi:hypothetical protein